MFLPYLDGDARPHPGRASSWPVTRPMRSGPRQRAQPVRPSAASARRLDRSKVPRSRCRRQRPHHRRRVVLDREDFRRADHDGDGILTQREFLGETATRRRPRGRRPAAIAAALRSTTTPLPRSRRQPRRPRSRSEWRESPRQLRWLDENRDGYLTRPRWPRPTPHREISPSLDTDRNGVIYARRVAAGRRPLPAPRHEPRRPADLDRVRRRSERRAAGQPFATQSAA